MNNNLQVGDWVEYIDCLGEKRISKIIGNMDKNNFFPLKDSNWEHHTHLQKINSIDQILPFKVDCKSIETSKKVQEILFGLGCEQNLLEHKYLFISDSEKITYVSDPYKVFFNNHEYQQIPVELLLWLGEQKKAYKFPLPELKNDACSPQAIESNKLKECAMDTNMSFTRDNPVYMKTSYETFLDFEHQPIDINLEKELTEIEQNLSVNKLAKDIPIGTYFTIDFNNPTCLYLKSYDRIINLSCSPISVIFCDSMVYFENYKEIKNISISYIDDSGKTIVVK